VSLSLHQTYRTSGLTSASLIIISERYTRADFLKHLLGLVYRFKYLLIDSAKAIEIYWLILTEELASFVVLRPFSVDFNQVSCLILNTKIGMSDFISLISQDLAFFKDLFNFCYICWLFGF